MDFSAKLEQLQAKANETVAASRAAAAENREQLKQRIDKAQDDANQAMQDAKQQVDETADRAESKWAQMKADAAARREDFKAKIEKRAEQRDAKAAARDLGDLTITILVRCGDLSRLSFQRARVTWTRPPSWGEPHRFLVELGQS